MARDPSHQDGRLVASALAGRRDAYLALFERHYHAAMRLAACFCDLDAMERVTLAEEVFARAFADLPALKEPARFESWLLILLRQGARSRVDRRRGLQPFLGEPARQVDLAPDPGAAAAVAHARALLEVRPETPRTIPQQLFLEGAPSLSDLARRAGLAPGTAEAQVEVLRARLKLRLAADLLAGHVPEERPADPADGGPHLRRDSWERTLRGERFPGEAAVATHLASSCEICEQRLSEMQGTDGLDGEVDRALIALAGRLSAVPTDAGFERVMRRVRLDSRVAGRADPVQLALRPGNGLPLTLAALLALAGLAALALQGGPGPRGLAAADRQRAAEVELSFSAVPAAGSRDAAVPGQSGAVLGEDEELALQYLLAHPAFVTLAQLRPDGRAEVLSQPGRMGAGRHDLTINDARARVSLRGAPGLHRFAALASDAPVSPAAVGRALESLRRGSAPALDPGVAMDWFEVEVRR